MGRGRVRVRGATLISVGALCVCGGRRVRDLL